MTENYYAKQTREAGERLAALLAKPMVETEYDIGDADMFDPWDLFPIYGSYGGEFDACAIAVLEELRDHTKVRDDLGAEMFREMLCYMGLCNYGTSPRVCFPEHVLEERLPELIEKWRAYSLLQWNVDVTKEG
jgi:hypothetical protein